MKKSNNTNDRIRAVAYCRFSSDNQREESIDAQLRAIQGYAEHNGIVLVGEYIDRAKSAMSDQRPEFQRMISDAAEGGFTMVIVHKLDRFARNRYDSADYRHRLKRYGVSIRSVIENLDDSPESVIMESVLEGMAEYYSLNLSREVKKGLKENALQGKHTGGIPPLGYNVDAASKKLVIIEHEAEAVRLIFSRTLSGIGYGEIIHELNALGYVSKRGVPFGKNSLHEILKNRKYTGVLVYNRSEVKNADGKRNNHADKDISEMILVENAIPQIISAADFELVQERLSSRRQTRKHSHAKETYLLTGKMLCGVCGGSYVGSRRVCHPGRGGYKLVCYGCNKRNRTVNHDCRNKEVNKDRIEAFVLGKLSEYVFSDKYITEITAEYNLWLHEQRGDSVDMMTAYRTQARVLATDIDKTVNLLIKMQSDALIEKLRSLENSKHDVDARLARLEQENQRATVTENDIRQVFETIRGMLASGTLLDTKQLISTYIQKIEVFPESIIVTFRFFPEITLDLAELNTDNDKDCADTQSLSDNLPQHSQNADGGGGSGGS